MVALKRRWGWREIVVRAQKQERRGGIETQEGLKRLRQRLGEAGTPWWH